MMDWRSVGRKRVYEVGWFGEGEAEAEVEEVVTSLDG
jgi:hypothetical protein